MQVTSSFFKGVDKRILQQQIDVHRLFLLTAFHHRSEKGTAVYGPPAGQIAEHLIGAAT